VGERGTRGWYGLLGNRDVGTVAIAVSIFLTARYIAPNPCLWSDDEASGKNTR
jgi:hypothetical protein